MKKNMGTADRVIRTSAAIVAAVLIILQVVTGVWAIVLGAFAVIFLITSFVSFCPLYLPFHLSTRKE